MTWVICFASPPDFGWTKIFNRLSTGFRNPIKAPLGEISYPVVSGLRKKSLNGTVGGTLSSAREDERINIKESRLTEIFFIRSSYERSRTFSTGPRDDNWREGVAGVQEYRSTGVQEFRTGGKYGREPIRAPIRDKPQIAQIPQMTEVREFSPEGRKIPPNKKVVTDLWFFLL